MAETEQLPAADQRQWLGLDGHLRVDGVDYYLREMEAVEMTALEEVLGMEVAHLSARLAEKELERSMVGTLDYAGMKAVNRAQYARALKRRQITAIHTEFARRKTLEPPLIEFAWQAIVLACGEAALERVMAEARALQLQHIERLKHVSHRGLLVSRQHAKRDYVCGPPDRPKIRHESDESALAQIASMEASGLDVSCLKIYPCPWCHKIHVGNDPNRKNSKRRKAREQKRKTEALAKEAVK